MDENKRNQQNQSTGSQQGNTSGDQQGNQQNVSNEQDQNPQDGSSWNNYRTREMGNEQQDEGNRAAPSSGTEGGGGTLY